MKTCKCILDYDNVTISDNPVFENNNYYDFEIGEYFINVSRKDQSVILSISSQEFTKHFIDMLIIRREERINEILENE